MAAETETGTVTCGHGTCSSLAKIWEPRENNNTADHNTHSNSLGHSFSSSFRHCFEHFVCVNLSDPLTTCKTVATVLCISEPGEPAREGRGLLRGGCPGGGAGLLPPPLATLPRSWSSMWCVQQFHRERPPSNPNSPGKVAGQLLPLSFYG